MRAFQFVAAASLAFIAIGGEVSAEEVGACLLQQKATAYAHGKHNLTTHQGRDEGHHRVVMLSSPAAAQKLLDTKCPDGNDAMTLDSLNEAAALGAKFLMQSQMPEGNFHYEYDWQKKADSDDDNSVRQAGTTWGLSLLYADTPSPELSAAILKAFGYFAKHSVTLDDGRRIVRYPGEEPGKLGTVSLLVLAHLDFLRTAKDLPEKKQTELKNNMKGYIKTLLKAEDSDEHVFHAKYKWKDGRPKGESSPYYDGESLLALIRVAQQSKALGLDYPHLWHKIAKIAEGSWQVNAEEGLKAGESTKRMKGFYQWSSMAMYELLETGESQYDVFADRVLRYADWITKGRKKKGHAMGGFLFEGIIPAYLVALHKGDKERSNSLGCLIRSGVPLLNGLQVGHRSAAGLASKAPGDDPRSMGGVQNSADSSALRIDTAQHQMHAILQAKSLLMGQALL